MKVLVLGACGLQGRAVVYDLSLSSDVSEIVCADSRLDTVADLKRFANEKKLRGVKIDVTNFEKLKGLLMEADIVIDLLPRRFKELICEAAIETQTSVVNTNYTYDMSKYEKKAKDAGIAIMCECGLDPGIDLVIYNKAIHKFDEIHLLNSYCGGFPEKAACDNPLNYKISWTWEGVLSSTKRDATAIKNGIKVSIPADDQHSPDYINTIDFPALGLLEAIPNGDAIYFTDLLGISEKIQETGRYSLRWPGWSAIWDPLKKLGFLDTEPVNGLPCAVTPYQFLDKFLGPKLQYKDNEKDLVAMINVFEGISEGKQVRLTSTMLIERSLDTGLMAMSKGVGYPASIVAQMINNREITAKGILTPALHVPWKPFMEKLSERGIVIHEKEEFLN
jgi:lysine 6-dehydrogenase